MNKNLQNENNPRIWVLVDDRVGNANQALALASKIGVKYDIKNIQYNGFAKFPNFLLNFKPFHVKSSILSALELEKMPDIIISSGRRTASLAVYLQKLSDHNAKIIQIMRPDLNPKDFSLIILPQHDNYRYSVPNVFRVMGALNNVQDRLPKAKEEFLINYPDVKNFIAVLIGGCNKKSEFTVNNAKLLLTYLKELQKNHPLPFFITFSRRTSKKVKKLFRGNLSWPHIIYDPEDNSPNPYPAIIGEAEYIITTADSISMCSEAASTGKPIYIFFPDDFKLLKHRFFIQQLIDLEIAKRLTENTHSLEKYNYEPLSEIDRVISVVKSIIDDSSIKS